jgi:HK97 family phage portal protein
MSIPGVQPWQGWPGDWQPPLWNGMTSGLFGQYVSTVYTCVDLNSRQLASFPVYRMRGIEHMPDLPWMTNPAPEVYADWVDFMKQLANTLQLRGEAIVYALARYADNTVARMIVLSPDLVNIEWANGEVVYELGSKRLASADICHIKYQTWPGALRGITPIQWIGRNLVSAEAMERYQADLATNGGVPWGVLTSPGNLTAEQADTNRQRWIEASSRRGTAPVMLGGGLTLETLTLSPEDMSLLALRVFDEQRICAAFGVPPYLVGLPQAEGLTYANASSLFDYHWRATLRPKAQTIAACLSHWALPAGQRIEFNRDEYTRPDFGERVQAYSVLFNVHDPETGERGITIEEIRQAERLTTTPIETATGTVALTAPVTSREIAT